MGALFKAAMYGAKMAGGAVGKIGAAKGVASTAEVLAISGKAAVATVKVAVGIAGAIILGGVGF